MINDSKTVASLAPGFVIYENALLPSVTLEIDCFCVFVFECAAFLIQPLSNLSGPFNGAPVFYIINHYVLSVSSITV